jgi:hypothetical protein
MQTLMYACDGDLRDMNMWCNHYFSYPITGLDRSLVLQKVDFLDNWHMKVVRLLALH